MPFVTPLEVMGAVLTVKQISALKTVARQVDKDGTSSIPSATTGRYRCFVNSGTLHYPDQPSRVLESIDDLMRRTKAKCIAEDQHWQERLKATDYWKEIVDRQRVEMQRSKDLLLDKLTSLHEDAKELAKTDPYLSHFVRALEDIRVHRPKYDDIQ